MTRNWNSTKLTWCLHIFLRTVLTLHDTFFSLKKKKIKAKNLQSPWINNGIKKTWEIIKNSIGKGTCNNQNFPKKVIVDNIAITDESQIINNFNKFFTEIGPKLSNEIETSTIKFDGYL